MTVCIAAICNMGDKERGPIIVTCSDVLISGTLGKAESRLKNRPMACGWGVMTAGDDGEMEAVYDHISRKFMAPKWNEVDDNQAMTWVREAIGERKREKIEELTMSKFGISYKELRETGNSQFPPDIYREAMWAVEGCKIDADCIVYGFDRTGSPQIITTNAAGHIYRRRDFGIIGAGGYLAQSMLLHRGYHLFVPFEHATYLVYEAKKHAEGETSVGEMTHVFAAERSGKRLSFSDNGHTWAQSAYNAFRPRPVDLTGRELPDDAFKEMFDVSKVGAAD